MHYITLAGNSGEWKACYSRVWVWVGFAAQKC